MGKGCKVASSLLPACAAWENTCVFSQSVLTGFAFGLGSYVTLLSCSSSPSLVRWERMSDNSSHSKMCAVLARPPPLLWGDKREPLPMHCLCPAPWPWSVERRKRRSFLSVCRQADRPVVCRWSLAAVSLWAAGQRHRQPWGKGAGGGWPRALVWPVLFPIPCFCGKVLVDNVVTQAVLMWSAAFLLGTIGVLILWFGFFLFFPPLFHQ